MLENENSCYKFKVHPCGSFPFNTKICYIDEFNFRLEWLDEILNNAPTLHNGIIPIKCLIDKMSEIHKISKISYRNIVLSSKNVKFLWSFFKKKRVMAIIMLRFCPFSDDQHEVSTDLAICMKTDVTVGDFWATENRFKNIQFEDTLEKKVMVYINYGKISICKALEH